MQMESRINPSDIYQWFGVFRPTGKVTEIRVIDGRGRSWSGYFKTPDAVINALEENPDLLKGNVFQTFNAINETCYERKQKDKFLLSVKSTSDEDIVGRNWVFIDIDPIRPSDTNATDEQEAYAIGVARKIVKFLLNEGFKEPVVVASANGAHIYLRCELKNTPENTKLCENFIVVMRSLFNDEQVKIDKVIFNASRFAKLPGTKSGKGNPDSATHPQRWCRFLKVPQEIVPTERVYFEKLINRLLPEPPKPSRENNWGRDKFNLQAFMQKHGISVQKIVQTDMGTRYILDHCVFNPEHKGKDAMIFQYNDGSIAYKCFHDSCSQYTWRDVRLLFEPDAYSRQDYADFTYKRKLNGQGKVEAEPQPETEEKGHIWLSLDEIPSLDPESIVSISTSIKELDKKIYQGTVLNNLTIMTGRPASGKSTLLNTILLSSVNQGFPTALFSGELPPHLLKNWITRPAAGRGYVRKSKINDDAWYVPQDVEAKIVSWLKGKLFIHNAEYGNNWVQLRDSIHKAIGNGVKNIILDNLMTIGLDYERDYEKSKAQINFISELHEMAVHNPIHIWLVAHPRKQGNFLRYDDIAGASEIANLADNIFVIHRVNRDFENQAKIFFSKDVVDDVLAQGYTNVIEIAKNRIPGNHIGDLIGVYYEAESKQMQDSKGETRRYGWDTTPVQQSLPVAEDFENETQWYNQESRDLNGNDQDNDIPF